MPKNKNKKTPAAAESEEELNATLETQSTAVGSGAMEPDIVQALDRIIDNLTKVIDTMISSILEAIEEQTSQLQVVAARLR